MSDEFLKAEKIGEREDGVTIYRLFLDGKLIGEGYTIEEVIREINRAGKE